MADMSFDVVYAGGGHGAMMSAPYFAMNGLSVGVFEMLPELGGGHCSEPRPLPGFTGNPCANQMLTHLAPQVQDFKLYDKGATLILPEYSCGAVWADGTGWAVKRAIIWDPVTGAITFNQENYEENIATLSKVSPKDVKKMEEVYKKMESSWLLAFSIYRYNPPPPLGELDAIEKLLDDPVNGMPSRWPYLNIVDQVLDIFEDQRIVMFLARMALGAGVWPDEPAPMSQGLGLVVAAALGAGANAYFKGGTHQVIHALQRVLFEYGGRTFADCEVDEIVIENGKAKGIKLIDGSYIEAKKMVVTNIEPRQLLKRQLRDFHVDPDIIRRMDKVPTDGGNIFWGDVAMHQRPKYLAEEFCPELSKVENLIMLGDDDLDYFRREYRYRNQHIRPGEWPPKLYIYEVPRSMGDPHQAPEGKHITLIEEYGPPASAMSEREWAQVRREFPEQLFKNWRKYAPNMTEDNIIGFEIDTPGDFIYRNRNLVNGGWAAGVPYQSGFMGRWRPIPELAHYKVPGISNLYLVGSSHMHAGGGSTCDSSYCMYKAAASDFGLRKFWEEAGRPY